MFPESPSYLIYISLAVVRMSAGQLIDLSFEVARLYDHYQVTGVSLYGESRFIAKLEGRFFHMLEGSKEDLQAVYATRLKTEFEHSQVMLSYGPCTGRLFPKWTLQPLTVPDSFRAVINPQLSHKGNNIPFWDAPPTDLRLVMLKKFYNLNGWLEDTQLQVPMEESAC